MVANYYFQFSINLLSFRLKDGKEIQLLARIRVKSRTIEGFTTNELIIDDVQMDDAGKYTVIVSNNAGQDMCEAKLEVIGASLIIDSFDRPPATPIFYCRSNREEGRDCAGIRPKAGG